MGDNDPRKESRVTATAMLQEQVATMMLNGAALDLVESEVIDPSDLDADRKAALWLYAWSFTNNGEQRAMAGRFLRGVESA
jgi:hypothetical protein